MFIVGWSCDPTSCCCSFNYMLFRVNTFCETKRKAFYLFVTDSQPTGSVSAVNFKMHDRGICAGRRVELLIVILLTCHWPSQLCLLALICLKLRILVEPNGTSGPCFNQISSLRCISICLSRQRLNPDMSRFAPRTAAAAAAGVWGCATVKTKEMKRDVGWLYRLHSP